MNSKVAVIGFQALLIAATAGNAYAGPDSYAYLIAGLGRASTEIGYTITENIDGDDTAFEIGAGYAFNRYLALEGSYQDFGEPDGFVGLAGCPPEMLCVALAPFTKETVSVDGWTAAVRGTLPVTDSISLFGRLGLLAWDTSARTPDLDESGTDVLYGAGVAVDVGNRIGLQLAYERSNVDIDTVKLGLRIRF